MMLILFEVERLGIDDGSDILGGAGTKKKQKGEGAELCQNLDKTANGFLHKVVFDQGARRMQNVLR